MLANHVHKHKLHIKGKHLVDSWNTFATSFSRLPEMISYRKNKGQSLRNKFNHMLSAARSSEQTLGAYHELMLTILDDIDAEQSNNSHSVRILNIILY